MQLKNEKKNDINNYLQGDETKQVVKWSEENRIFEVPFVHLSLLPFAFD